MKKYRISEQFVLRRYGNLLLGYFTTDTVTRYFTFNGLAAQIINLLMNSQIEEDVFFNGVGGDVDNQILASELSNLVDLRVIEVE